MTRPPYQRRDEAQTHPISESSRLLENPTTAAEGGDGSWEETDALISPTRTRRSRVALWRTSRQPTSYRAVGADPPFML